MPGFPFPVHYQLRDVAQTHVHRVGDAIQPSHPLSSPSPPALNLSYHKGLFPMSQLFASGGQSIGVSASTSVLQNEHQGLISFRMDWLNLFIVIRYKYHISFLFPAPSSFYHFFSDKEPNNSLLEFCIFSSNHSKLLGT